MEGEQVLANVITYIFSPLYQLAVALSFTYFLYGVLRFIWIIRDPDAGDATKRNEGKQHMIWGTVGLFIILSVGGIIQFANDSVGGLFQF